MREDQHVDKLLTKSQSKDLIDTKSQLCKSRKVFEMLFDVIKIITRNGLALCGCEFRDNDEMKSWLENSSSRKYHTTYMSPQYQSEIITLLGEEIRAIISDKVNQSGFCSVMADTTPDVSHSNELSVTAQFLDSKQITKPEKVRQMILSNLWRVQHPFVNYLISNLCLRCIMVHKRNLAKFLSKKSPTQNASHMVLILLLSMAVKYPTITSKVYDVLEQLYVFFTKST